MNFKRPDRHQQALAILAIATAAIGVSLFGGGLNLDRPSDGSTGPFLWLTIGKSFAILFAVAAYFLVFTSVIRILGLERPVTGQEIVSGPLLWLYWEMFILALIFMANAYITFFA